MPHSGGGGSHGGGSHSSSSSSHGGSGGSSPSYKHRTSYFAGSHCYVRYHNNKTEYIYSDDPNFGKPVNSIQKVFYIIITLFLMPFIFAGIGMILASFHHPVKQVNSYYDKAVVYDFADVFTDKDEDRIVDALAKFNETTGIPVTLWTDNLDYQNRYTSLENYAYDIYVNQWNDEDHLLLVYATDQDNEWEDWYFEIMQGDNTDSILTDKQDDAFNEHLTELLMKTNTDRADAFVIAFNSWSDSIMNNSFELESFGFALLWNGFIFLWVFLALIRPAINRKKYKDYVMVPKGADQNLTQFQRNCEYCGGMYIIGTVTQCPHCAAPIKAEYQVETPNTPDNILKSQPTIQPTTMPDIEPYSDLDISSHSSTSSYKNGDYIKNRDKGVR